MYVTSKHSKAFVSRYVDVYQKGGVLSTLLITGFVSSQTVSCTLVP